MTQTKEERHEMNVDQVIRLLKEKNYQAFDEIFLDLHAYDQAQIFQDLNDQERKAVYYVLSPDQMADLFDMLAENAESLEPYFYEMDLDYAAELLEHMFTDNAVDMLEHLDENQRNQLLAKLNPDTRRAFKIIMNYGDDSAGSIMTTEFISLNANLTTAETMDILRKIGPAAEMIYYLYVVDAESHLLGVVSLRDLVVASNSTNLHEVMMEDVIYVHVDDDQEDVAHLMRDYDFLAVPVLDREERLTGIITVDDIVDVIDEEAAEDYSRLAAVDVDEKHDSPFSAAFNRMPWLVSLLILGLGTSSLIAYFEGLVSEVAILAVFISLITGTAGNAGTQSLAVAVRRISSRDNKDQSEWALFINELTVGVLTGLMVGVSAAIIVGLWQRNIYLGLIVGIAMFFAVIISTMAGTYVPMLIESLGFDPAVASGPFITTLTDLTSVFIYFSVASFFLPYLV